MKFTRTVCWLIAASAAVGSGAALAAASTSTPAATATATTGNSTPAPRHWHHHGGMLVGVTLRAVHQLNLTSEQQTQIKSLLTTARSQSRSAAGTADMAVLGNPGDPGYAAALQTAKGNAASRLQRQVELQSQIYNVLTSDQKAKLPQVLADMKAKAEARRAAWKAQHPAAGTASGTASPE
jgi:Spy/CpxP family protein refolding chaperone